jgi:nucleoside-diphosphate-sugar epimerase
MTDPNNSIIDEGQLEERLSRPSEQVIDLVARLDGDYIILGIAGKIGPSLAGMLQRACAKANIRKRIIGVSRFSSRAKKTELEQAGFEIIEGDLTELEQAGFEIIEGDLLNINFITSLPQVKNVLFLAGMKFGSEENLSLTWAVNSYLPALVAEHFRKSRIVAYSTGCVYELVPINSGGSLETDIPAPIGEYAQSCLGRERMFEYGSQTHGTRAAIIRLNYAVECRYGVLVDIALKVMNEQEIDLTMGYFNVIWQGDANEFVIRTFDHCQSPAMIVNVTGAETLSVRTIAKQFADLFNKKVRYIGKESETALLSNAQKSFDLFGRPKTSLDQVIQWIAEWLKNGYGTLNKPTHFEVRNGKY